jgi:hypothetical protein
MSSIAVSGVWSLYDYFWQWSDSEEVYLAMRGDVRDAAAALGDLPDDDIPVYFMAGDAGRVVRYLAPERARQDLTDTSQLPVPIGDEAYLVAPRSAEPAQQLSAYLAEGDLIESGDGPGGQPAYRLWAVGPRTLDRLPYAVPAIPFENGWSLPGFNVTGAPADPDAPAQLDIVLLWEVPPDADPFIAEVRLRPKDEEDAALATRADVLVEPWKNAPLPGQYLLVHVRLPFPRVDDLTAGLFVGLRDPVSRTLVTPLLNAEDDGYAFLNDLHVIPPER